MARNEKTSHDQLGFSLPDNQNDHVNPQQESLRPGGAEVVYESYALAALDLYALQNSRRGYQSYVGGQIHQAQLEGYPDDSPDIHSLLSRQYTSRMHEDRDAQQAKLLFARAIGIATKKTEITDARLPAHRYVFAEDPGRRRELDSRYAVFLRLYAGTANAGYRDSVRQGKASIVIPTYSELDRLIDRELPPSEVLDVDQFLDPVAVSLGRANRYGLERVEAAITTCNLLIDALNVQGLYRGRLLYKGTFKQKLFASVDHDTSNLRLPNRQSGQSLKAHCDRLSIEQLPAYTKQLHAIALRLSPESVPLWGAFWATYNGWEDDSNLARTDLRHQLKLQRSQLRRAERTKRKQVHYRLGQVTMNLADG